MENKKKIKINPIEKHSARVIIIFLFICVSSFILSVVINYLTLLVNYLFKVTFIMSEEIFFIYIILAMLCCWQLNVRFGLIENIIEDKKKYSNKKIWFEQIRR